MDLKYFDISEFDSPDLQGTAILHMDSEFLLLLDQIREQYGRPIHINSGYRTAERNRMVGGKADSAPQTCLLYTSPSPRDRTRSRMPSSA